jgi:phytol kinase
MFFSDYMAMTLVLGTLTMLIGVAPTLAKVFQLSGEDTRKFVHLIMGVASLSFPWLFSSALPIVSLLLIVSLSLIGLRKMPDSPIKRVLFGVERRSLGEIFFPVAVTIIFILAGANHSFYVIPIAILAVADSLAALVGTRVGLRKYRCMDGSKTVEGSLTFFAVAFLCAFIVLSMTPLQFHGQRLIVSLILALVATTSEGMSFRGLDNLLVPLATFFALVRCANLDGAELLYHCLVLLAITSAVLMLKRRSTLEGGATLAVLGYGFVAHAMGGLLWLTLPVILFAFYRVLLPIRFRQGHKHSIYAVVSVAFGGLAWLFAYDKLESPTFLYPYALGLAINASIIASAHLRLHSFNLTRTLRLKLLRLAMNSLKSFGLLMLPLLLVAVHDPVLFTNILISPLWIFNFTLAFLLIKNQSPLKITSRGRWLKQGLCASIGSLLAFAVSL